MKILDKIRSLFDDPTTKEEKIDRLQRQLRRAYKSYVRDLDEFSCGANLAAAISLRVATGARKVNDLLDQLAKLDPDTPKDRMPLGSN